MRDDANRYAVPRIMFGMGGAAALLSLSLIAAPAQAAPVGSQPTTTHHPNPTPLHVAAKWNHAEAVVAALVDADAEVTARDQFGKTPLYSVAEGAEYPEMAAALLSAGADLEARNHSGWTPLHAAAHKGRSREVFPAVVNVGPVWCAAESVDMTKGPRPPSVPMRNTGTPYPASYGQDSEEPRMMGPHG